MSEFGTESHRLFLAVAIPDGTRRDLSKELEVFFENEEMPGRPVRPANWHLTLRFLGDTPVDDIPHIREALRRAPLPASFPLRFDGLGAFRNPTSATVLWINLVDPAERLAQLAAAMNRALEQIGIPPNTRPFVGHLTISRIRKPQNLGRLMHRFKSKTPPFSVHEAILFRSHLGQGPARYEVLERYSLV